ncbi:V-type proton ATPase subunit E [Methanobrevibacter oralis]|uniref:A-type ATP synthase subunit E n=1 Tax=Methanobrevibacter oralis TaxID=66851 RepID=A0A166AT02_METOA|nr:V-type proton ATPase subunit E [Methanobrevibacter oralis]KZX12439.1 V-type proton ATPase subunit E [Methanobrevibacter oralis]
MSSGTDKIVSSIMSEAQEKADIIIQNANAEVSTINARAEKTAEAEKSKILENGKKQSDMRYQQIISEAKMNARRAELGAKEEVIEAAFTKASEELKAKASSYDDEYSQSLIANIKEAASEIGGGDLIVQLNGADSSKIENKLSELSSDISREIGTSTTLKLGEPIEAIGGAIVKTSNGYIEVNNTIESRLDRFKSVLRSEVASILFK